VSQVFSWSINVDSHAAGPGISASYATRSWSIQNYVQITLFTYHINVTILLTFWPLNAFRSWWPRVPPLSFVSSWSRRPSFTRWTRKALQSNERWHNESQCIAQPSWLTDANLQCKDILSVSFSTFACNNLKILNRNL
jgi:hypothetical protein